MKKKEKQKENKETVIIQNVLSNDYDISETFKSEIWNLIKIPQENFESAMKYEIENLVQNATNKFKIHPGTKMII